MRFRSFAAVAVMATTLGIPLIRGVQAQDDSKPIALISVAPVERVLDNTSYLLKACNVPEVGGVFTYIANQYTQGLDKTRPIGATVTLQGQMPSAVIFLPMTDRDAFFGAFAAMGIEPDDLGDGLFEIDANGQTIFAKDAGGWMFVAQTEDALTNTPADPAAMLGRLPETYDVGIRLNIQALPEPMKQMVTQQMRIGFERGMAEQGGQTPEEQAAAREMGEASIEQIEQLISDTEQVFLGWSVNEQGQSTYFDLGAQFMEGSQLASQADAAANQKSSYTAFDLPGASATFRASSTISDSDKALAKNNLKNSMSQIETQLEQVELPDEAKEMVKELISGLARISEQTIDEGIVDSAGSLSVADDTLRVLVGGRIADGNALASEFKKAVAKFPDEPNVPTVEFDYATHNGFTLHKATVPLKIADPGAKKVFGDELNIIIGTADKHFLVALDPTGDTVVKSAIDEMMSAQDVAVEHPFEAVIEFEQLLRFAQSISPNSMLDNAITTMSDFAGKDKVSVKGRVIPRGAVYRVNVEEGVMRSIGAAAKSGGGGGGF